MGNSLDLVYFYCRIQQGLLLLSNTLEYLLDLERITRIFGKIVKSSSEMAKIARPAQETPKFLGQLLCYCTLIEKLTRIFHSDFQQYRDTEKATIITYKCYFVTVIKILLPIAGNQSNSCTIYHIVSVDHISTIISAYFIKIHVFFSVGIVQVANNKLKYLVQYLVPIFYADIHEYGLFHSEIVLYFLN